MKRRICAVLLLLGYALTALARTDAPAGAELYFIEPRDGAVLESPITVKFGLRAMGVAPAGINAPNTGHHHLLIDAAMPSTDFPIPNDETRRHFGGGQTEAQIELPPGEHTLQLLLGDHLHIPHDPPVRSSTINITVRGPK
jgi:hypothetical protein